MSEARPVFFTSIPKCGKNLVYSFYAALGVARVGWNGAPAVLHHAHFSGNGLANYAFAGTEAPSGEDVERAWIDIEAHMAALAPGSVTHGHFLPDRRWLELLARHKISAAFVLRDPRDALVSMLNYARAQAMPSHVNEMLAGLDDESALLFLLNGGQKLTPFADYFDAYHGWLSTPGVQVLRFEDLIGLEGGGDAGRQRKACAALARIAGIEEEGERFAAACQRVFNPRAGTFFRGQIGGWRERFTPAVLQAYERAAAGLAERWGYVP